MGRGGHGPRARDAGDFLKLATIAGVALIAGGAWYYFRNTDAALGLGFGVRPDPFLVGGGYGSSGIPVLDASGGGSLFTPAASEDPAPAAAAAPGPGAPGSPGYGTAAAPDRSWPFAYLGVFNQAEYDALNRDGGD